MTRPFPPALPFLLALPLSAAAVAQAPVPPTFTEHIAPIVFRSCAGCHRPGEAAPFPLLSWQDVRKHGRQLQRAVAERLMPPWPPEPGYGEFQHSRRLADAEVLQILDWVKAGMPEGPKDRLPAPPAAAGGWQLGEPDLAVRLLEPVEVPASGRDLLHRASIPLGLPEDRWLLAIDVQPSARPALRHVLFFASPRGRQGQGPGGGQGPAGAGPNGLLLSPSLGSWAAGDLVQRLPEGLALRLPAGSSLSLQLQLRPSGRKHKEQTTFGLYFAKAPPARTLLPITLPPAFGLGTGLLIPAGSKEHRLADQFELPCDVDAVLVTGHAHLLCRSLRLFAEEPSGKKEPLLLIRNWSMGWQNRYAFKDPVRLSKGSKLVAELLYDNSKDNPANPNRPPKDVRWGREPTDEQGGITLFVAAADEADSRRLSDALRLHALRGAAGERLQQFEQRAGELFDQYDKDKDGKLRQDELPPRLQRMFDLLDRNGDGALDKDEAKALGFAGGRGGTGGV